MRIEQLKASNFRCFPAVDLTLSPTINVVVGCNNSGKSSLLTALSLLQYPPPPSLLRAGSAGGQISIRLSLSPKETLKGFKYDRTSPLLFHYDFVKAEPQWISGTTAHRFERFDTNRPNHTIVPYFSSRRASGYDPGVSAASTSLVSGTHHQLIAKVDAANTSSLRRAKFIAACERTIGFAPSSFGYQSGKMVGLEIETSVGDYNVTLNEMGAGIPQVVGLLAELVFAKDKLFLIEEPENDLHPAALRSLLELIAVGCDDGNQFVVSTHSNIVVRTLGSTHGAKVFNVLQRDVLPIPTSSVSEVPNDPAARMDVLRSLGYELSDLELFDAFLIFEESSAENIVEAFLIPWFVPELQGRVQTVAAQGADDVEPRLIDFGRLMVFLHRQPIYESRTWILMDGDQKGKSVVESLKRNFAGWPEDRFRSFNAGEFERYYPAPFSSRVEEVLAIKDKTVKRKEKARLARDVGEWLRIEAGARQAIEESARQVIGVLREIAEEIVPKESNTSARSDN